MVVAVLLLLAQINPDRTVSTMTQAFPTYAACKRAYDAWIAGEPDAHAVRPETPATRYALCVTLPAVGRDA